MIPLEGAFEELAMDLQFGFEAVALRMVDGSGEGGLRGIVGCRAGELVDLRVEGGSGGR
jgi:hypothetical protein